MCCCTLLTWEEAREVCLGYSTALRRKPNARPSLATRCTRLCESDHVALGGLELFCNIEVRYDTQNPEKCVHTVQFACVRELFRKATAT